MSKLNRRKVLQTLAAAPAAAAFVWTAEEAAAAAQQAQQARTQAAAAGRAYAPKFFTAHEYATITALVDMIIPKDDKSGSASDAGTPEFIDYLINEQKDRQTALRGGLAWLDTECVKRFDKRFLDCADADRRKVLDDIAFPRRARPEHRQGARFFTTMRVLAATGFWSSQMGVADLGYVGNRPVMEWLGAPQAVLDKLGVKSD